jgi:hypothetical protein
MVAGVIFWVLSIILRFQRVLVFDSVFIQLLLDQSYGCSGYIDFSHDGNNLTGLGIVIEITIDSRADYGVRPQQIRLFF